MINLLYNVAVLIAIGYLAYQKMSKKADIAFSMMDLFIVVLLSLLKANNEFNHTAYILTTIYGITLAVCVTDFKRRYKIIFSILMIVLMVIYYWKCMYEPK